MFLLLTLTLMSKPMNYQSVNMPGWYLVSIAIKLASLFWKISCSPRLPWRVAVLGESAAIDCSDL